MRTYVKQVQSAFNNHPVSMVFYVLSLIPWLMVCFIKFRVFVDPPPEHNVAMGEGMMFGVILATLCSVVLLLASILNLTFQKNNSFYIKLITMICFGNLVFYTIGTI